MTHIPKYMSIKKSLSDSEQCKDYDEDWSIISFLINKKPIRFLLSIENDFRLNELYIILMLVKCLAYTT